MAKSTWPLFVLPILCAGCEEDLGACDQAAAEQLVYGQAGVVATKGQALLHESCGNAAFCHSSNAIGGDRLGAPVGMSFDMLPQPSGWPSVVSYRGDIWSSVRDGSMPPGKLGERSLGEGGFSFDPRRREGSETLPALESDEGKAILRNWLACDAPVVADTRVPSWLLPEIDAGGRGDGGAASDFAQIFSSILAPSCATSNCHDAGAAGGLSLLGECGAYAELLERGACGLPRVVPGDQGSLLLDKLTAEDPACGGRMPPIGSLRPEQIDLITEWIAAGAEAPGCEDE